MEEKKIIKTTTTISKILSIISISFAIVSPLFVVLSICSDYSSFQGRIFFSFYVLILIVSFLLSFSGLILSLVSLKNKETKKKVLLGIILSIIGFSSIFLSLIVTSLFILGLLFLLLLVSLLLTL